MKPHKTRRESMQIRIYCFEIRFVETDLVQFVKPYKTRRKIITVSRVCMVSHDFAPGFYEVFMASRVV